MSFPRRLAVLAVLALAALPGSGASAAAERVPPEQTIRDALARAGDIPAQAAALAALAWPEGGVVDHALSSLARERLVLFGDRGLAALRARLRTAPPRFRADIVSAVAETRLVVIAGRPADFLPALNDAIWYGTSDAQRIAMYELRPHGFRPAMLPMIDAALEHPEIRCLVARNLGRNGDDRARFFLRETLFDGPDDCRATAARALAEIAGLALDPLREGVLAERAEIRAIAVDALLPVSSPSDLTTLFEYLGRFPADDADRRSRVEARARHIDEMLGTQQDAAAGSGAKPD